MLAADAVKESSSPLADGIRFWLDVVENRYEKLRVFFGWSRTSLMPHHYARAYFEDRLATVWQDSFDLHIETLRKLSETAYYERKTSSDQ